MQGRAEAALAQFRDHVQDEMLQLHGSVLALHDLGRHEEAQLALEIILAKLGSGGTRGAEFLAATANAWVVRYPHW